MRGFIDDATPERLSFSVSPFYQTAKKGKDRHGNTVQLGDIHGPWGVLGLLYGPVPCGQSYGTILANAFQNAKFCGVDNLCPASVTTTQTRFMHDPEFADPEQRFGFLTVPLKYRKGGIRFEASAMLANDFGLTVRFGFSDISQELVASRCNQLFDCDDICCTQTVGCTSGEKVRVIAPGFIDLTPFSNHQVIPVSESTCKTFDDDDICTENLYDGADKRVVEAFLISKLKTVFKEIGLNVCDFHDNSIEDVQFSFFWRHIYDVNSSTEYDYSPYSFIPFFSVDASIGTAKIKDPSQAFSLPFGNNGHHAIGATGGFDLDFTDTISIGFEGGFTHFFSRDFCDVYVPTNDCQSVLYPFKSDIHVEPGNNWHTMATLNAIDFVDRLSFYAAYIYVNHSQDNICITGSNQGIKITPNCTNDPCTFTDLTLVDDTFKPGRLAKDTGFSSQMINAAFNYSISPYGSIGLLWQIPVTRRQAYRSSTVLFTFNATF